MTRLILITLALSFSTACFSSGSKKVDKKSREEIELTQKKVQALDKRVRALEAMAKSKAKAKAPPAKAKAKAPGAAAGPRVAVKLDGDAAKVALSSKGKRFTVPGQVPPGNYNIMAQFGDAKAEAAGKITVANGKPVTLTCSATDKQCVVKAG